MARDVVQPHRRAPAVRRLLQQLLPFIQVRPHVQMSPTATGGSPHRFRLAHDALGAITGRTSSEDLLGQIFSRFCIGK